MLSLTARPRTQHVLRDPHVLHGVMLCGQIAREQTSGSRLRLTKRFVWRGGKLIHRIAQRWRVEWRDIGRFVLRKIILQCADVGHHHRLAERGRFDLSKLL